MGISEISVRGGLFQAYDHNRSILPIKGQAWCFDERLR